MKTSRKLLALALAALLSFVPSAWRALGQEASPAGPQTIVEVRVEGNQAMSTNAVLALIRTRMGQTYDEKAVNDDQRRLTQSGRFNNAVAVKAQTDKGVIVTFTVTERPLISGLKFRGNANLKDKDLRPELTFGPNDPLDANRIELGRLAIQDKYKSKGYYFASVLIDPDALRQQNQVIYDIVEGPRVSVSHIRFQGNHAYGNLGLRLKIKTSSAFWPFTVGRMDEREMADDVATLRTFYRQEGYLDAEVTRDVKFARTARRPR